MILNCCITDEELLRYAVPETTLERKLAERLERHADEERSLEQLLDTLGYGFKDYDDPFDALVEIYDELKRDQRLLEEVLGERDELVEEINNLRDELKILG